MAKDPHLTALAEAVVYDSAGNEIGRGSSVFMRSRIPLRQATGYAT